VGTRILTVEDDERIRTAVKLALEDEGWVVDEASSGEEALQSFSRHASDVVLIDIMLPGIDGFEVCRSIRRRSDVPIVMVTARADTHDVVAGLEAGADDYVTKPFGVEELLARLRAALRRSAATEEPVLHVGGLTVDLEKRLVLRDGEPISLTPNEFALIRLFARNEGKLLTHRTILREVWGRAYQTESHYLHVYISQLRRKIEPDPARPRYLLTEPGAGYRLVEPSSSEEPAALPS